MKKILSGAIALSMVLGSIPALASNSDIVIKKTNYVVGTTGVITGADDYSSSNESIVSVDVDGTITAVAPGNAVITADGEKIPINVYPKGIDDVENVPAIDIADGKYSLSRTIVGLDDKDTALHAFNAFEAVSTYENDIFASGSEADCFMGAIYKLDGELDDVTAHFRSYDGTETLEPRVEIAYMTGNKEFVGRDGVTYTLESSNLKDYGLDGCMILEPWAYKRGEAMVLNTDIWTKANTDWYGDNNWHEGDSETSFKATANGIPADATYLLVLMHQGNLPDGTPAIDAARMRYRGIELNYKKSMLAAEINSENQVAVTFNKDVKEPNLNITKNGKDITETANVQYDADNYTAYIDDGFKSGDNITVRFGNDSWSGKVEGESSIKDFESYYFKTPKTTYIVGGTGKINLIGVKGDEEYIDPKPATYISDSESVIIDNNGNFTAVSSGVANITPNVDGKAYPSITLTVKDLAQSVDSFITDDVDNGLLDFDFDYSQRGQLTSEQRHGTKLWAYGHDSNAGATKWDGYVYHESPSSTEYFGFVYKLEGKVDTVTAYELWYGDANRAKARTKIGYITDDSVSFVGQDGVTYTWGDPNLCWWGANYGVRTIENGLVDMNPMWTPIEINDSDWVIDNPERNAIVTASGIPEDAKYMIVFLNGGVLADGSPVVDDQHMRYKGVTIKYKSEFIGKELNSDNKIALTLNNDIENVKLNVFVNGEASNSTIVYDKSNYTYYVSGFNAGDYVQITSDYGNYEVEIPDNRELIASVGVDGVSDGNLIVGTTELTTTATVRNCKAASVDFYGALFDSEGELKNVSLTTVNVDNNGEATVEFTLSNINVEDGDTYKVFCWKNGMTPIKNYNDVQTVFETGDF